MATLPCTVEVEGLIETQEKMEQVVRDLYGSPFLAGMHEAVMIVTADAKRLAPVDTGRLRASITGEVRTGDAYGRTVKGIVGSNVVYAPFMELGTRPHWPPLSALEVWARRHGTTAFAVARAISIKGTKARRFLQRALEDNAKKIFDILGRTVQFIVRQ